MTALTPPYALRRSPTIEQQVSLRSTRTPWVLIGWVDGDRKTWTALGHNTLYKTDSPLDLIPLQLAPVADDMDWGEWMLGDGSQVYLYEGQQYRSAKDNKGRIIAYCIGTPRKPSVMKWMTCAYAPTVRSGLVPMIEHVACDGLVEALDIYINTTSEVGSKPARAALAAYRSKL